MDSSKSPHAHPGSASASGELPPHGGGSSISKKKMISTSDNNEPEEEEEDEDTATSISQCRPWRIEEINLLNDILDFYHKTGRYPYSDMDDQQDFFKNWVLERRFYRDEIDLNRRMDRLNTRFLMNMEKKSNGEDIEVMMDPTEMEIFRLSIRVWGKEDEDDHDKNDHGGVNPHDRSKDSYEHETDGRDAVVDTKDLLFKDWIKEAGISGHGSKCSSSSKDSSSNEKKDGSLDS